MTHKAQAIEHKQISDSGISVRVRCCGDASTDSWHTIMDVSSLTSDELDERIAGWLSDKEAQHEKVLKAQAHLDRLIKGTANATS